MATKTRSVSPQTATINADLGKYLEKLQERWVPRDQLEEWNRTMHVSDYQRRVRGVAVRFLAADMSYKVGWVSTWECGEGQENLIVDAGMGATEVVLLRNVSNSKFNPKEVSPEVLGRLYEAEAQKMKKASHYNVNTQPSTLPPPELHPHVLVIGGDGKAICAEPVSEIVSRAVGEDPDTPRSGGAGGPGFQNAGVAPDAHMISREGTGTAAMVETLERRTQASHDEERWLRSLLDMTRALAKNEGRRGGGVSKPYYCQQV